MCELFKKIFANLFAAGKINGVVTTLPFSLYQILEGDACAI